MKHADKLRFGTAGIPLSTKPKNLIEGIKQIKRLGLDALEIEFVYGVKISKNAIELAREISKKEDILLTAHAPYYINLNATSKEKLNKSLDHIFKSAEVLHNLDGYSLVFHPGWYLKQDKKEVWNKIYEQVKYISKEFIDRGYEFWIRLETMDHPTKFGTLEEIVMISKNLDNVLPCIDFAHIFYRYNWNSLEKFYYILEYLEKHLGETCLKNMHIHISGIILDKSATHCNLEESLLKWKDILTVLKEFKIRGVIISESPNLEGDALKMKQYLVKI